MEKDEKALLEELKFFDMNNLYQKGSYIDFNFQNYWFQAYIQKVRANNKYDITFLYNPSDTKDAAEINSKFFGFFGEHSYKIEMGCRNICFNREIYENDIKQILQKFKLKLKKSNLDFDFENKDKKKSKNKENDSINNRNNKEIKNNEDKNNNNKVEEKEKNEIKDNKEQNNEENNANKSENENQIKEINENAKNENDVNKIIINESNITDDNNKIKDNQEKNEIQIIKEKKDNDNEIKTKESAETKKDQNENQIDESTNSSENKINNINIIKDKEQNKTEINNNSESKNNEKAKIVPTSLTKLDSKGNPVNISGYYTFQLLGGYLIDCSILIMHNLNPRISFPFFKELFELCLDTIIFIANTVLQNMGKLKTLMSNRKLIIVSQTYAILASFELVLNNFADFYQYELGNKYQEIVEKFKIFANICYNILIESQKINALPLNLLINLIKFLSDGEVNCNINDYDENKVYKVFLSHIEHLTENELKNIKSNELMKKKCFETINMIFKKTKMSYVSMCYNSYLINCLKCNNLEKKMNALNDINEIIESINISREEIDKSFYDFFIKKNKILDIFFEESVHEEILKRANYIFKYLSSFNKLDDEILDKLIQGQKNDAMKNILCDVISELPSDKKNLIFNNLIKNLNFDEKKTDIEYITRLTESCLENESYQRLLKQYKRKQMQEMEDEEEEEDDQKEDSDNKECQNYYGLTLLFDYIIKDFNEKKPYDKNNVNPAIDAFNHCIQSTSCIESKEIFYFMDLLFDNIKTNEKHNSVIQSLILIRKLIVKLYENTLISNSKDGVIKQLNEKYNIITLIVNDLERYINIFPKDENYKIDDSKIYEGIYPHKINIEERLDLIFMFNRYKQYEIEINIDDFKKLYKLFKPKVFKKEMLKLLNRFSRNLSYFKKDTIQLFYKDILLNPDEFDIINFEDLNALNIIKDIFYKINHDNNSLIGKGKKLRVIKQPIEGLDFLFDILIKNRNKLIQIDLSRLLCDLCLNLYDYKDDFAQKYWKFYIDKIEKLLVKIDKENNLNELNGIINLIDIIYTKSCDFGGVIPTKEDLHQIEENHEIFQIHCDFRTHKDYKILVGYDDTIYLMRWKCGYYYDLPVNNIVLVDKNKKRYNLLNDNEKFFDIFPPHIYSPDNGQKTYCKVNVIQENDILLSIQGNPKILIEENENLLRILIKNLSSDNQLENDVKQKIYNIIKKMPKKLYIEQNIKSFGNKEKLSDDVINKYFNYENIYVLSYFLECFDFYIKKNAKNNDEKENEKDEFLNNFIQIQNGEHLLINLLLNAKIDYENVSYIQIECMTNLINLINFINKYKNDKKLNKINFEYIHENISIDELITKLSEVINSILKIRYDEINSYNFTSNISSSLIIIDVCILLDKIIGFIDDINSDNKTYYLSFLLKNKKLFKDIFLYNYMKCKEEKLIEILHTYFISNIFKEENLLKSYLDIMLCTDIFKYLIENDTKGDYFRMLTSIMQKFYLKNMENKNNQKSNKKEKKDENIKKEDTQNNDKNINIEDKSDKIDNIKSNQELKDDIDIIKTKNSQKEEVNIENNENKINVPSNDKEYKETNDVKEKDEINNNEKIEKEDKENNQKNEIIDNKDKKENEENLEKKESESKNEDNETKQEQKEKNDISEKNEDLNDSKKENEHIAQFKVIIDLIIEHIKQLCEESPNCNKLEDLCLKNEIKSQTSLISEDNHLEEFRAELIKNKKIDGIISFLQSILNLYKEELVNYFISKVDIIDLFLNKCILSKCNINSLDSKFPLCSQNSSQDSVFHLIIFILGHIPEENNLYMEIIRKLYKYHNIGFWKNNSLKNWELDTSETNTQKYIGLKNLSSTCYMNSILQQIFMIPMLRETILSIKNSKEKTVLFELQLLFSALKVYESQYYDPSSFVLANKLNFYEQMDADEYFGIFIDKIESDIKNLYPNDSENKYKDLFRFFFGIKALDELKFVDCNHKRYNEFFYNNIQLEVKGFNNLDSSMKNYFKTEIMDGENKINCEECHMKRTCHKRQIFKSLPNILVINLKRFEFDYNTMLKSKLNNYFEFPFELDMKEYLIEDHKETNTKYELTGITIHFGFSDYGHYYDLIKSPEGKWYKFNDNTITEFDEKDIPHEAFGEKESEEEDFIKEFEEKENGQNNAYILIYKKINFDEDTIDNISKNYICDLASPPYSKFSNINEQIKSIINIKMFKFWTLQSIVSLGYQNFILNLLKYDIAKKNDNNDNEVFEFGLIYFFNIEIRVIFRQKERSFLSEFVDIMILYIEKDLKKAKYILEEFSNVEVINEYLVSCPTKSGLKAICNIIQASFKKIFDYVVLNQKSSKENSDFAEYYSFLFKFINTYVLFITYNTRSIQIEAVNYIFYELIKTSEVFIKYLKSKHIDKWVNSFFNDDDEDEDEEMYLNAILTEKQFPKIKSTHKILSEKKLEFNGTKIPDNENDFEMEQILMNRNRDLSVNTELIKKLHICFRSTE